MDNIVAKDKREVEGYREKIFMSKEECRKIFAEEPFENKLRVAFELYKMAEYIKKIKFPSAKEKMECKK